MRNRKITKKMAQKIEWSSFHTKKVSPSSSERPFLTIDLQKPKLFFGPFLDEPKV